MVDGGCRADEVSCASEAAADNGVAASFSFSDGTRGFEGAVSDFLEEFL